MADTGDGVVGVITPPLVAENFVCSNSNFSPTGAITPDHPPPCGRHPPPPALQKILYPRLGRYCDVNINEENEKTNVWLIIFFSKPL